MKRYLTKHALALILIVLCSCASALVRILIPLIVGKAIDSMMPIANLDFALIKDYLKQLALCAAVYSLSQWLSGQLSNRTVFTITREIRNDLFARLQQLPLSYLDSHLHGQTINILISDVEQFCDGLLLISGSLFGGIITILTILIFMFRLNGSIALTVVLLTPLSLLIARFIARNTHSLFTSQSDLKGKLNGLSDEFITSQKRIRTFNYHKEAQQRFDAVNEQLRQCSTKAIFFSSLVNPSTRLINNAIYALTGLQGALMCLNGTLTVGALSVFLSYAGEFGKPFNDISSVLSELQSCRASGAKIEALLSEPLESRDDSAEQLDPASSAISFEDIHFSYDKIKPIIAGLSLNIRDGERVALVGTTGCGKTTLINLLLRFYDPDKGTIRLDGTDITAVSRASLRSCFGMVLQDSWVKQSTIRENLIIGNPAVSQQRIDEICAITHCDSFIRRMKDGYETVIADDNVLSAGQKQLLSIARVMIADPRILILDEATSNIDTRTEINVQKALEALMENKTSLIVAHRLSTIVNCDRIVVMDKGQIIEQGSHKQLLAQRGFYYTLYNSQFRHGNF
jgi:ATP-binding cassette subfamily B protein